MNGFLLLLVHEMDDCPIGLYATAYDCRRAARVRHVVDGLTEAERAVIETDASTPLGFVMVEFVGGLPIARKILKWKDE